MDDVSNRLTRCFSAVFPTLAPGQIATAEPSTVSGWDSVASVTLFATVEEEFGVQLDLENISGMLSYQKLLEYLRAERPQSS